MMERCARCWARGSKPCVVCNYPLPPILVMSSKEWQDLWDTHARRNAEALAEYEARRLQSAPFRREAVPCTCIGDTWDPTCPASLSHPKQETPATVRGRAIHAIAQSIQAEEIAAMTTLEGAFIQTTTPAELDLYETRRLRSASFRPGHYPADMTKRERHARRLMASAITPGALVHYMGVYAGSIP